MKRLSLILIIVLFLSLQVLTLPLEAQAATPTNAIDRLKERMNTKPAEQATKVATRVATMKERIASAEARFASRAAALRQKLNAFRDQKKATAAARISESLNKLNTRRVEDFDKKLDDMQKVLTLVTNKAGASASASINTSIASASAAIDAARAADQVQADKDYTIAATNEAKLREEVKTKRDALHDDLKKVQLLVSAARSAVSNAISSVRSALKGN